MAASGEKVPAFNLASTQAGARVAFPSGRRALLCFVKEDCPTCVHDDAAYRGGVAAFGARSRGRRDRAGRGGQRALVERHRSDGADARRLGSGPSPYAYNVEIVPTIILADAGGAELGALRGLRHDRLAERARGKAARRCRSRRPREIDWDADPKIAARMRLEVGRARHRRTPAAEAAGERACARAKSSSAPSEDPFEFMFERGLTDGLPVVPPTPERVMRMLTGTRRDPRK